MSKNITTVFFFMILVLMVAVGFLAVKTADLNHLYFAEVNAKQQGEVEKQALIKRVEGLESELNEQKNALTGLSVNLANISEDLSEQFVLKNSGFMRAPEYSVDDKLYAVKEASGSFFKVTGNVEALNGWIERNEPFLEHVMKRSMPLDYDKSNGSVVVQGIVEDSVFYQMGLRDGDRILTVNGRRMTRGGDLRSELIKGTQTQVALIRDKKRVNLTVAYEKNSIQDKQIAGSREIQLDMSKEQFNLILNQHLSHLKLEPTPENTSPQGVKILEIDEANVFNLMDLKAYDVITQVDGEPVDNGKLASILEQAEGSFEIDLVRENQLNKVSIKFSEN